MDENTQTTQQMQLQQQQQQPQTSVPPNVSSFNHSYSFNEFTHITTTTNNNNSNNNNNNNNSLNTNNNSNNTPIATNSSKTKPLEMNTYVQLEIDNNNCLCIPRTCKFNIVKLVVKKNIEQLSMSNTLSTIATTSTISNSGGTGTYQNMGATGTAGGSGSGGGTSSGGSYSQNTLNSVIIAIKLNVSKRVLRTIELPIDEKCFNLNHITIDLNLHYNITYPHFLKKDTNYLHFYIQRRKKYKNRPIFGYKTLAHASIDLQNVVQRPYAIKEVPLESAIHPSSSQSSKNQVVGMLCIQSLTSQAIDFSDIDVDIVTKRSPAHDLIDMGDDMEFADDDDTTIGVVAPETHHKSGQKSGKQGGTQSGQQQSSTLPTIRHNSDSEIELDTSKIKRQQNKNTQRQRRSGTMSNNKFTGKLISFIRKLRNDSSGIGGETSNDLNVDAIDDDEYIEQISDFSGGESDAEAADLYSIISTPKPSLQPFFNTQPTGTSQTDLADTNKSNPQYSHKISFNLSSSMTNNNNEINDDNETLNTYQLQTDYMNQNTDSEYSDLETSIVQKSSQQQQQPQQPPSSPPPTPIQQIPIPNNSEAAILKRLDEHSSNNTDIQFYLLIQTNNDFNQIYMKLKDNQALNLYLINDDCYYKDLKLLFDTITNWLQQPKHRQSCIKLILFGNDKYLNQYLQVYVDTSFKTTIDESLKFYFIPYNMPSSSSYLIKYLFQLDSVYMSLFGDEFWLNIDSNQSANCKEMIQQHIQRYLKHASSTYLPLQIGEIMINSQYDDDLPPQFIPFICDIRIGVDELNNRGLIYIDASAIDEDCEYDLQIDYWSTHQSSSGSGGLNTSLQSSSNQPTTGGGSIINSTQTSSLGSQGVNSSGTSSGAVSSQQSSSQSSQSKITKSTLKAPFKAVQIYRPVNQTLVQIPTNQHTQEANVQQPQNLSMICFIKEKKQKIMRLGKKSKEHDHKKEVIDGLTRLVCTSRTHTVPLKVYIDGNEYKNIKFFQISSQWQGHIKHLNMMFGAINSNSNN